MGNHNQLSCSELGTAQPQLVLDLFLSEQNQSAPCILNDAVLKNGNSQPVLSSLFGQDPTLKHGLSVVSLNLKLTSKNFATRELNSLMNYEIYPQLWQIC